jgi:hypothetical protein
VERSLRFWKGPYQVLLATERVVLTAEKGQTTITRIKGAPKEKRWIVSSSPSNTKATL